MMKIILAVFIFFGTPVFSGTYQIEGDFDGCEYGKLYPIVGGGILECLEYNYFYDYSPTVRSDGRQVITIGDEVVEGYLHNGSVIQTKVFDDFEGCDWDKKIEFLNGLSFICSTYSYTYSYMPDVKIFIIKDRVPEVYIGNKLYSGTLYKWLLTFEADIIILTNCYFLILKPQLVNRT